MRRTTKKKKLTVAKARSVLRALGLVLSRDSDTGGPTGSGEFRVNFRGGRESTAYYTDDLDDAYATGCDMAAQRARTASRAKGRYRLH